MPQFDKSVNRCCHFQTEDRIEQLGCLAVLDVQHAFADRSGLPFPVINVVRSISPSADRTIVPSS